MTGQRIALVVGNAGYRHVEPLKNPKHDADTIASALSDASFSVISVFDGDYRALSLAFGTFQKRLAGAGAGAAGCIYFAGHGVQHAGRNFLLPVDVEPQDSDLFDRVALPLDWMMHSLSGCADQTHLIILDACRNNPFTPSARGMAFNERGLSKLYAPLPPETLLAYATKPGDIASDNGLYATTLAEGMAMRGIGVEPMLKWVRGQIVTATAHRQIPWDETSLVSEFYFRPPETDALRVAPKSPFPPPLSGEKLADRGLSPSPSDEEIRNSSHLIHKLKAKDSKGKWAYYFVLVSEKNELAFLDAIKGDSTVDLERFGKVVASNYGEEPSEEVRALLKERYGFDVG